MVEKQPHDEISKDHLRKRYEAALNSVLKDLESADNQERLGQLEQALVLLENELPQRKAVKKNQVAEEQDP